MCPKKDKVWLKADTFRSHCELHPEDDCEDLLERSRINLGYLDFEAAVRLCELKPVEQLHGQNELAVDSSSSPQDPGWRDGNNDVY